MSERKNFWDRNAGWYDRFMRKDRAAYEEMYTLIRPVVKAKTVLELATGTALIAPTFTHAENSFSGKVRAFFMKLAGFLLHSKWASGIPALPAAERLDGAEKHCSESLVPIDLCGMCEIGGVRCHSLKIPASPWALVGKLWSP